MSQKNPVLITRTGFFYAFFYNCYFRSIEKRPGPAKKITIKAKK